MKSLRLLLPTALLIACLSAAFSVYGDCTPADTGTPADDTIDCTIANPPVGDVTGQDGDDAITIEVGVTAPNGVSGDYMNATDGSGDDVIINNGTANNGLTGDSRDGDGTGNDIIINNGDTAAWGLFGDSHNGVGTGNDNIINNGTTSWINGDSNSDDGSGSDGITNNGTVTGNIEGDTANGNGTGNDVIVNNGTVGDSIYGDTEGFGVASGDDVIVNSGTVTNDIYGDGGLLINSGSDTIINNGSVGGVIVGDAIGGVYGGGNDTIINNGNAVIIVGDSLITPGTITGDDAIINNGNATMIVGDTINGTALGNDVIVNNGTVNGAVYGDAVSGTGLGNDTITNAGTVNGNIVAGGGADTVIIQGNDAVVGGVIDGGADYDVLTFNLTSTNPLQLQAWAEEIAAANPSGGTLILNGHIYTWLNFEELTRLLFSLARINGVADPFAVFCSVDTGIDVYIIAGQEGIFSVHVSAQQISNGIAAAAISGNNIGIGSSSTSNVYAFVSGEVQVTANGYSFNFIYQDYCGTLPEPGPESETRLLDEEEYPPYTVINQAYGTSSGNP